MTNIKTRDNPDLPTFTALQCSDGDVGAIRLMIDEQGGLNLAHTATMNPVLWKNTKRVVTHDITNENIWTKIGNAFQYIKNGNTVTVTSIYNANISNLVAYQWKLIGKLPVGYRPTQQIFMPVLLDSTSATHSMIKIHPDGDLQLYVDISGTHSVFGMITFAVRPV